MNRLTLSILIVPSILLLIACSDKTTQVASSSTSSATTVDAATVPIKTDAWVGTWKGPEGTSLLITGKDGNYIITIADLDGTTQYEGATTSDQIAFERDGIKEAIQASNGADTGMKWLAEKSDCLRVRMGEGWCRD